MKKIFLLTLVLAAISSYAQVYNNEWIDYSKTYYKFKVGKTGLHRINHSALSAAGLGAAPAENFQLWRNGIEVPIFTSVFSGSLSASDYIEFWGEMNDGKADKPLYRNQNSQLNDKWSLETDTAAYFLTVNTSGANQRLVNTANNIAGNTLAPEPYFMYTAGRYFRDKMNQGYAVDVGEYLYSSSYDRGEGWTSADIGTGGTNSFTFSNLFPAATGPDAKFKIHISGNSVQTRTYKVNVNGTNLITGTNIDYFNFTRDSVALNNSLFSSGSALVEVNNAATNPNNRMVIHQYELTYARLFNFGGASNFEFTLSPSSGNYLEITGFAAGSNPPVLYDLTNKKRYVTEVSGSVIKVVLQPSYEARNLVLVNAESSNITPIASLQSRIFVNYSLPSNAGNYLIISNPLLFTSSGGSNPIEDYRQYRSSANGGGYNAKTFIIDDLVDQFAFGIKRHPLSIRNFVAYARTYFPTQPKHVFLIGKGLHYMHQRAFENHPDINKLNFVPTFGWPASDVLLTAEGSSAVPKTPIGRLSVINGDEVALYLKKMKDFELAQRTGSPYIADKAWMKNVVHVVGASEPALQTLLDGYMTDYKNIIKDTLFGANVTTFTKSSPDAVEQINSNTLGALFKEGISLITYFGHSSSSSLEFNLNNPDQYDNQGKYPVFVGLGCNAGNYYNFNLARLSTKETISEKFVLAPERGTIGFMASSHFGIVHYLDIYSSSFYKQLGYKNYGKSMGEIMQATIVDMFAFTTEEDFYARAQAEENSFHGDPALKVNPHPKPDYVIEEPLLKVSPTFVSIADPTFNVKAKFLNIGRAINKDIVVQVGIQYPSGVSEVIHRDTIPGIRFADSININVPIDALRNKGTNRITVKIDADEVVDELYETNNTLTRDIIIFEDEARPVYPQNFAIVNKTSSKLIASTANPLSALKTYRMELDTTELFNSSLKVTSTKSSTGGLLEFDPGVTFKDSTVIYWRVASIPPSGPINWKTSSFVYLANHEVGSNQSHYFQFKKSTHQQIILDSVSRAWRYDSILNILGVRNGIFPTASGQEGDFTVAVNGIPYIRSACVGSSLIFNVFDPITFKPLTNPSGFMNSGGYCAASRLWNFEYSYMSSTTRKHAMDFMDWIPNGSYVVVRSIGNGGQTSQFANDWKADTTLYGSGNSLYHKLKNSGLSNIDSFYKPRVFALIYKKGSTGFTPVSSFTEGIFDLLTLSTDVLTPDSIGYITSPQFGPAKSWKELRWRGASVEANSTDNPTVNILGIKLDGTVDTLFRNITPAQAVVDVSSVNATQYPYMQLSMRNIDSINFTPYQLKYWRLTHTTVPEGAIAPNVLFTMKDTFDIGEPIEFKLAFKNVSDANFIDSMKIKMVITDKNNITHVLPVPKHKVLLSNDTLHVRYPIDSKLLGGSNMLYVDVNPDNDQPEQYHFNNFLYKSFFVRGDTLNPLLDVTFDNMHILNGDIISSKPDIIIKLKDESNWILDDTSLFTIRIRYPDAEGNLSSGSPIRNFSFNSDTVRFTPAKKLPNSDNTATINFNPYFEKDGDYELIVTGRDNSNNEAGKIEYRVGFKVINKAMISNMLNYPNPFTTSTAFVFTITGAEVPQNVRIQVLTITGKVVKEITKEELGSLRIGKNITDYKWDGTDQYGQKLANGVYLYRVITSLNGKSLDKYQAPNDDTDKYFNKGYGKMYLMR